MQITLSATDDAGNPREQQMLYTCPFATEAECLVDVTDQASLDAIAVQAGHAKVRPGTYDTMSLALCAPGKSGGTPVPGFVRGVFTVTSESKTYATEADASNVTGLKEVAAGDDAGAEFAAIGNWGCSQKTVTLPEPVVVVGGHGHARHGGDGRQAHRVLDPERFARHGRLSRRLERAGARHLRLVPVDLPARLGHQPRPRALPGRASQHRPCADRRREGQRLRGGRAHGRRRRLRSPRSCGRTTARPRPSRRRARCPSPVFGGPGYFGETVVPSFHVNPDGSVAFITGGSLDSSSAIFTAFQIHDHVGVVDTRELGSWHYHALPVPDRACHSASMDEQIRSRSSRRPSTPEHVATAEPFLPRTNTRTVVSLRSPRGAVETRNFPGDSSRF